MKYLSAILLLLVLTLNEVITPLCDNNDSTVAWTDLTTEGEKEGEKKESSEEESKLEFINESDFLHLTSQDNLFLIGYFALIFHEDIHLELHSPPPDSV